MDQSIDAFRVFTLPRSDALGEFGRLTHGEMTATKANTLSPNTDCHKDKAFFDQSKSALTPAKSSPHVVSVKLANKSIVTVANVWIRINEAVEVRVRVIRDLEDNDLGIAIPGSIKLPPIMESELAELVITAFNQTEAK